jgi:hypothetical protein
MALAIADAVQLPARRRWAYRLLTVALLLLLGLTLAEVGLRRSWTPPSERSTPSITPHELYGWAPIPGLNGRQVTFEYDAPFSHSAQGTRGRSPLERRAGERVRDSGSLRHRYPVRRRRSADTLRKLEIPGMSKGVRRCRQVTWTTSIWLGRAARV